MITESRAYVFNLETTKIELHFEKSEYGALTEDEKRKIRSNFLWSRKGNCWVSRAKEPNLWGAIRVAKELGFTEEERRGERLSFAEQVENRKERAEARAERFEVYADNAEKKAENLQKDLKHFGSDIAFLTQPNINTTAGRAFTKRREAIFDKYKRGFEEYRKSDYFKSRAETAKTTASQAQYKDPAYLNRRIKECKSEISKRNKNAERYEKMIEDILGGQEKKKYNGEIFTLEEAQSLYDRELELIEKAIDKQGYLENRLEELGGLKYNRDNIKVGYVVKMQRFGLSEIISTGPQNVQYKVLGCDSAIILKASYAEILEVVKSEERKTGAHPYKVGETFNAEIYEQGFSRTKVVYEIIKITATTVTLKRQGSDEKPIARKPKLIATGNGYKWRLDIDDRYCNSFYKEETV